MYTKPVVIGDNVWIGEFASVLPGVTIGNREYYWCKFCGFKEYSCKCYSCRLNCETDKKI